eukprot:TRINITY_DN1403_c0_g1_i10.p1 TRINITY_DN1403_c0_g1~~TRINITY_DN1403_c0_g1_i10.p1  ORF type:complete len:209 (-),score=41.27 TRINITY_DN1403_c0_g1_i10:70-648(-)
MKSFDCVLLPKAILAEINTNRHLPHLALPCYIERLQYFDNFTYSYPNYRLVETAEGTVAVTECIDFLRVQQELPALSMHKQLSEAAQVLANVLAAKDNLAVMYEGTEEHKLEERVGRYVKWTGMIGECVNVGNNSGTDIVSTLLIDDGNETRPNRRLLLDKGAKFVGIGCALNEKFGVVTVIDIIGGESNTH